MHRPKLSIITITKNDSDGLLRTILSIPDHSDHDLEYVVIDGNSENQAFYTPELKSKINVLVISKDNGISDAFNKGIINSNGEFILMLNSGDELLTHVDINVVNQILNTNKDIVCFGVLSEAIGPSIPNHSTSPGSIPHQGLCVRRYMYETLGLYIHSLKLRMDYEFILRAKSASSTFDFPGVAIASYAHGGLSTLPSNRERFYQEGLSAELLHLGIPRFGTLYRYIYWKARSYIKKIHKI